MNFKYLSQQYGLGRFRSASQLDSGTVSQVWRLETDEGTFLVRSLTGKEQGEREWSIHQHLRRHGFTAMPAIVVPCFEQGGLWYQVQEYLDGTMPDPTQLGMAASLAKLAKELAAALSEYPDGSLIHGDLGPWNILLQANGALCVIDFGGARFGDPYFDFASLLAGIINHTPAELRESVCGTYLRELNCDRGRLLEQLHCWAEEGKERWAGVNETMAARFDHALNWAKEHIYEL